MAQLAPITTGALIRRINEKLHSGGMQFELVVTVERLRGDLGDYHLRHRDPNVITPLRGNIDVEALARELGVLSVDERLSDPTTALTLVGAELPTDEIEALNQVAEIDRVIRFYDGQGVDVWTWHFPSFEHAQNAAHKLRGNGINYRDAEIRTVDDHTGKNLPS